MNESLSGNPLVELVKEHGSERIFSAPKGKSGVKHRTNGMLRGNKLQ